MSETHVEKIKVEFEGWHCIPKRETKEILNEARQRFKNANFIDNCGILVETAQPDKAFLFCLDTLQRYKNYFTSWDGYIIKKISKRIIYNYQDKKRKLSFNYFKKLITENNFNDIKLVLAGILYISPDEAKIIFSTIECDMDKQIILMNDEELKIAYNQLIKHSSSIERKFNRED
jgi:hypothetical protein